MLISPIQMFTSLMSLIIHPTMLQKQIDNYDDNDNEKTKQKQTKNGNKDDLEEEKLLRTMTALMKMILYTLLIIIMSSLLLPCW
jgi:hypothetical protein